MYLCYSVLHNLLIRHVALVADEQLVDALGGVAVDLLKPLLDVVERVHVGHVVNHADAVRAAVVRRCDCAETLLAGRIPLFVSASVVCARRLREWKGLTDDLQLHSLAIELDRADFLKRGKLVCRQTASRYDEGGIQSQRQSWRCSSQCMCHLRTAEVDTTFQRPSLQSGAI